METSNLGTVSNRIVILLHVVHCFPKRQHRCYCALRENCSNYLFWLTV